MNGDYLLDTSILVGLLRATKPIVSQQQREHKAYVATIVLGELFFGAFSSNRVSETLSKVNDFISKTFVLGCDTETARRYGEIRNILRKKGRPIPDNDIWIAAVALQHGLTLVTRDVHFNEVEGLKTETW